jgi:AbrB family looped-hinge helix DNA binding protein
VELICEQTKLSTRGQIVIPKVIRDLAGLSSGDELEVTYDGNAITLLPISSEESTITAERAEESTVKYRRDKSQSRVWAERLRALGRLKRLQEEAENIEVSGAELLDESRSELEGRGLGD